MFFSAGDTAKNEKKTYKFNSLNVVEMWRWQFLCIYK